jgi:hypothetical protein
MSQGSHLSNTAVNNLDGMKFVRLGCKEAVSLQSVDDPVDIGL